ncbi:MAG: hypothetical protein IT559_05230 [Alphaproteobacteria bacterium]|nr:hypothetical protein [Alphaproteobacteria bacterium]
MARISTIGTMQHRGYIALRALAVLLCAVMVSKAVTAAPFAPDACDPEYYESMQSRAWLEAQREITQNQNLIFKPDSVLEYTCFDKFAGVLVQSASTMFSESTRWGPAAGNMANALTPLIGAPMAAYESSNFDHTLLGGRMDAGASSASVTGGSYTLPGAITAGSYTCDVMRTVWMAAKCMDFIDEAAEDGFFTFAEYAAQPDKRFLPTRCSGIADYTSNMDTAIANPPWERDPIVLRLKYIYPPGASSCGGVDSKIKTGLTVEQSTGGVSKYEEHVCLVPGCHYKPSTATNGTCVIN